MVRTNFRRWPIDKSNNKGISQPISIEVDVPAPTSSAEDTQPPTITITSPADNSIVSNSITVRLSATDNIAISKVEVYVNGGLKNTIDNPTLTDIVVSLKLPKGGSTCTITALAYDASGNNSYDSIHVKIQAGRSK